MNNRIIFCFSLLVIACSPEKKTENPSAADASLTTLHYAEGFTVSYQGNTKRIEVTRPFQGATKGYSYLLVPKTDSVPEHPADVRVIRIPISSIVCTSTTHIPLLDYLNESEKLIGFPSTDYISSEKTRRLIDAGKVEDLGVDKGINMERLAMLKPEMIMGYTMSNDYGQFKKIEELGIPAVINAEYLEKHPLGRAEWIKFMAMFFNKEKEADSVFKIIEKSYLDTKALCESIDKRPTVLSGVVYGDAWFMPGGQNYAARILKDAGCDYLWASDTTSGFLELSFESVYSKAFEADRWIGVGSFSSRAEIKAADERYAKLKPFRENQIYSYNARKGAKGGSEFLELGYLRPDIILKDLVRIAHPDLLPEHQLFFHKKVE
jgi:iron complex transport system substrate-binding protein